MAKLGSFRQYAGAIPLYFPSQDKQHNPLVPGVGSTSRFAFYLGNTGTPLYIAATQYTAGTPPGARPDDIVSGQCWMTCNILPSDPVQAMPTATEKRLFVELEVFTGTRGPGVTTPSWTVPDEPGQRDYILLAADV
jgi:hypothetical protein